MGSRWDFLYARTCRGTRGWGPRPSVRHRGGVRSGGSHSTLQYDGYQLGVQTPGPELGPVESESLHLYMSPLLEEEMDAAYPVQGHVVSGDAEM